MRRKERGDVIEMSVPSFFTLFMHGHREQLGRELRARKAEVHGPPQNNSLDPKLGTAVLCRKVLMGPVIDKTTTEMSLLFMQQAEKGGVSVYF